MSVILHFHVLATMQRVLIHEQAFRLNSLNSSDSFCSWGCSTANGLKDTSQRHGLLSLQEFPVPRPARAIIQRKLQYQTIKMFY